MKEARYFYFSHADELTELPREEAQHALRVLRLQAGDEIFLMDGYGTFYKAEVTLASGNHCLYEIKERLPQEKTWKGRIHLAIAPTKMMDRMEWMVEKATEVGFDEVSFLNCQFSERRNIRIDRIDKIVVSAMKQSRKPWKPVVNELMDFKAFVGQNKGPHNFIAHCYDEIPKVDLFQRLGQIAPEEDITILVGPEGDFSIDEVKLAVDHGYESISLGRSRLRTETAGLMAVSMAQISKRIL
ncbi:MAG: 16S rRNA (uracil(1498)-N(3))-methyltransferase [Prevotella sp.]|nr:16S rRNA (uracil(1498)-N(3))-methyltransferase [Prevotella sp.]